MKLTIERKQLLAALAIVKPASRRSNIPILSHVAISTFDKSVEFYCTDLDMTLRTKCEADVKTRGTTTVRAALLHDLVKSFSAETVELELVKETLHVTCGKSKYKLSALGIEEFPPLPKLEDPKKLDMAQGTLRALLASTSFCHGTEESRYILMGSLLSINGKISAVATDGRRLATLTIENGGIKEKCEVVLPHYAVTELLNLLPDDDEVADREIQITLAGNAAQCRIGDTVLTTKLIEGNYPNYSQVIPNYKGNGTMLNRKDLITCLERCALISDKVILDFRKQTLNIRAVEDKGNGSASESLLIPTIAEPVKITFSNRYLTEALHAVSDDEVEFFGEALQPAVLKIKSRPWLSVIMPMRGDEKAEAGEEAQANAPAEPQAATSGK